MRIVVLDDYQDVAQRFASWETLDAEVITISNDEQFVQVLRDAEVIVAMRERTQFSADRLVQLPNLRLLVTPAWQTRRLILKQRACRGGRRSFWYGCCRVEPES